MKMNARIYLTENNLDLKRKLQMNLCHGDVIELMENFAEEYHQAKMKEGEPTKEKCTHRNAVITPEGWRCRNCRELIG